MSVDIDVLLKRTVDNNASDLHLRVPSKPILRIDGAMVIQEDLPAISADYLNEIFNRITTPEQRSSFYRDLELDFAYSLAGSGLPGPGDLPGPLRAQACG